MNDLKFKVTTYLKAQNWQRIGAMLFIGFFAICVAVYFGGDSANNPLIVSNPSEQDKNGTTLASTDKPIINVQNSTSEVALKDPFKIPEKFKALPPAPVIKAPVNNTPSTTNSLAPTNGAKIPKLKLTGIIGSGATREAIVEVGGKSRSYKKMDMIIGSPYQLIYMTGSAAVFRDSRGEKITLTIGR